MRWILIAAAILGASSIMIGAAQKHITGISEAAGTYEILQTGLRYHQIHTVVLLALGLYGLSQDHNKQLAVSALLFIAGIFLFSGGLYTAVILDMPRLTLLTPIGGICFITGWLSLAFIRTIKANET
ncbi:MAG: DUF423 domain-containing protein [Rhodospirillales bacterium]|nr:DUF423 domain-containing protein [Rhodospirillales bacterium]MCB9996888.1 DUF423 domain-containing protein [Rhodospirillales bacterium]